MSYAFGMKKSQIVLFIASAVCVVGAIAMGAAGLSATVSWLIFSAGLLGLAVAFMPAWLRVVTAAVFAGVMWASGAPLWWVMTIVAPLLMLTLLQGALALIRVFTHALEGVQALRFTAARAARMRLSLLPIAGGPMWGKAVILVIGSFLALGMAILIARLLAPKPGELLNNLSWHAAVLSA